MRGMKFGSGKFGARKRAAPGIAGATSGVDARGWVYGDVKRTILTSDTAA